MVEKFTDMPKTNEDNTKSETQTTSTERTQETVSEKGVEHQDDKIAASIQTEDVAPKSPDSKSEKVPVLASLSGERTNSHGKALCNVENCDAVLSEERYYYQRYKICRKHLRSSKLLVDGLLQRFCQQCGRFHDLVAFDGEKRNCRFRLEKHNSRRRKMAAEFMGSAEKDDKQRKAKRMTKNFADLNGGFPAGHFSSAHIPGLDHQADAQAHLKVEQQRQDFPFGLNNDQALFSILSLYYNSAEREMLFPREFVSAMDSLEKSFGIQVIKDILCNHMKPPQSNGNPYPGYNPAPSLGQQPYYDPRANLVSQLQHHAGYGMMSQNRPMSNDYRVPSMASTLATLNPGALSSLLARRPEINSHNQMGLNARTMSSQPAEYYQATQNNNNNAVDARQGPSGLENLLRALQSRETGDSK